MHIEKISQQNRFDELVAILCAVRDQAKATGSIVFRAGFDFSVRCCRITSARRSLLASPEVHEIDPEIAAFAV